MSLSSKKCCVPSCMNSGGMQKPLHLFPNPKKYNQRFNKWVSLIGGDIIGLNNEYIHKRRRVCHAHFEQKFVCRYKKLSILAIPTLNLPDTHSKEKTPCAPASAASEENPTVPVIADEGSLTPDNLEIEYLESDIEYEEVIQNECPESRIEDEEKLQNECPESRIEDEEDIENECPELRLDYEEDIENECPELRLENEKNIQNECPELRIEDEEDIENECPELRLEDEENIQHECPESRIEDEDNIQNECPELRLDDEENIENACPESRIEDEQENECPELRLEDEGNMEIEYLESSSDYEENEQIELTESSIEYEENPLDIANIDPLGKDIEVKTEPLCNKTSPAQEEGSNQLADVVPVRSDNKVKMEALCSKIGTDPTVSPIQLLVANVDPLGPVYKFAKKIKKIKLDICQICLRTDRKVRVIDNRLSKFHAELCDSAQTFEYKFCTECEHMLRKLYNFKVKCKKADVLFKKWMRGTANEKSSLDVLCTLLPPTSLGHLTSNQKVYNFTYEEPLRTYKGARGCNPILLNSLFANEDTSHARKPDSQTLCKQNTIESTNIFNKNQKDKAVMHNTDKFKDIDARIPDESDMEMVEYLEISDNDNGVENDALENNSKSIDDKVTERKNDQPKKSLIELANISFTHDDFICGDDTTKNCRTDEIYSDTSNKKTELNVEKKKIYLKTNDKSSTDSVLTSGKTLLNLSDNNVSNKKETSGNNVNKIVYNYTREDIQNYMNKFSDLKRNSDGPVIPNIGAKRPRYDTMTNKMIGSDTKPQMSVANNSVNQMDKKSFPNKENINAALTQTTEVFDNQIQQFDSRTNVVNTDSKTQKTIYVDKINQGNNKNKIANQVDNKNKIVNQIDNKNKIVYQVDNKNKIVNQVDNKIEIVNQINNKNKIVNQVENKNKIFNQIDNKNKIVHQIDDINQIVNQVDNKNEIGNQNDNKIEMVNQIVNKNKRSFPFYDIIARLANISDNKPLKLNLCKKTVSDNSTAVTACILLSDDQRKKIRAKRTKLKKPFSKKGLLEELNEKFSKCGELNTKDGATIDKDFIIECIKYKVSETLNREIWNSVNGRHRIKPNGIRLLTFIQNKYKSDSQYQAVFEIEYLNTKEKMIEEFQKRKTYDCYVNSEYKCEVCLQGFKYQKALAYHQKIQHKPGSIVCPICATKRTDEKTLNRHISIAHEAVYKCKRCPLITYYRQSMINHYHQHIGVKYRCEPCGLTYKSKSAYLTHVGARHRRGRNVCTTCGRAFLSHLGLTMHVKWMHKEDTAIVADVRCEECELAFSSQMAYHTHIRDTHPEQIIKEPKAKTKKKVNVFGVRKEIVMTCRVCNAVGTSMGWLSLHFRTEHPSVDMSTVYPDKQEHLCHVCGKGFKCAITLRDHMNRHFNLRPYPCGHCSKRFYSAYSRQQHRLRHFPPKFVCSRCGKTFHTRSNLYCHMRIHINDRRFKCSICLKGFIHQSALNEHIRGVHHQVRRVKKRNQTHTGTKNVVGIAEIDY